MTSGANVIFPPIRNVRRRPICDIRASAQRSPLSGLRTLNIFRPRALRSAIYRPMMNAPEALIADFLAWIANAPRPYGEALERWRTSCPRLPVWEDAFERGLVRRDVRDGVTVVDLTTEGRRLVSSRSPQRPNQ